MLKFIFILVTLFIIAEGSKNSNRPFKFILINDLIDIVDIQWIDYEGMPQSLKKLKSGDKFTETSYYSHEWVLKTSGAKRVFTLGQGQFRSNNANVKISHLSTIKTEPTNQKEINYGSPAKNTKANKYNSKETNYVNPVQKTNYQNHESSNSKESDCNNKFQSEMLYQHNKVRSQHNAPQMRLSRELNEHAVEAANESKQRGALTQSRNRKNMGENLGGLIGGGDINRCTSMAKTIFDMWYKGEKNYNYNAARFSTASGLFTQIVWATSTQLGCGVGCNGGQCFAICNYRKAGNVIGQFKDNVFPSYY